MIVRTARGNLSPIDRSINWSGLAIGHHPVISTGVFASLQAVIALGMAWRPTVKAAPARRPWLAPRREAGCHIVMCVAMGYMLVPIL